MGFEIAAEEEIGFRFVHQHRYGYGYVNHFEPEYIQKCVDDAWDCAKLLSDNPHRIIAPLPADPLPTLALYDNAFDQITDDAKMSLLDRMVSRVQNHPTPRLRIEEASYSDEKSFEIFRNSFHQERTHQETSFMIHLSAIAQSPEDPDDEQGTGDFDYSAFFQKLDPQKLAHLVLERSIAMLGAQDIPSGHLRCTHRTPCRLRIIRSPSPSV